MILHFMKRVLNQIKMTSILHTLLHYLRIVLNYISSFFFDHQHGGGRSGGGGDGGIVGLTSFFFGTSYQKKLLTFDNGLQGKKEIYFWEAYGIILCMASFA